LVKPQKPFLTQKSFSRQSFRINARRSSVEELPKDSGAIAVRANVSFA
jgi:hypothetical protein